MKENRYDDEEFFDRYSSMKRSVEGLKGAGEWHTLERMLPSFSGKRVLDLGCGFGWHCIYAAEHGADAVVGIDISERMIEGALRRNPSPKIQYLQMAIEDYGYPDGAYDIVLSSLAIHYLESFDEVCRKIARTLVPGGSLVFSVEHPVFTAYGTQDWYYDEVGRRLHWPVDKYFAEGRRQSEFLGQTVPKYHRTLTTYMAALLYCGFEITGFAEPEPDPEMLDDAGMRDELRRPMMMILSAIKKQ